MASTKHFRDFILDHLKTIITIEYKPIMGEFLLYINGKLFGGIYDQPIANIKTTDNSEFGLSEVVPYKNSLPIFE